MISRFRVTMLRVVTMTSGRIQPELLKGSVGNSLLFGKICVALMMYMKLLPGALYTQGINLLKRSASV